MDNKEFNNTLILNKKLYNITEYIEEFNKVSKYKINLFFMKEMLKYIDKDECVVPYTLLRTYGVFNSDTRLLINVTMLLHKYELLLNQDFIIVNTLSETLSDEINTNSIYLHPNAFKICILGSKNSKKYISQYILLEKFIKYYYEYQILYRDTKINILENKLSEKEFNTSYYITKLLG